MYSNGLCEAQKTRWRNKVRVRNLQDRKKADMQEEDL